MSGGTSTMTEHHRSRRGDAARYGTLDVPLSVWQVADAAALTAALLEEFRPARGPIITIDVPGWEAVPRSARHAVVFTRERAAATAALASIPGVKQGLARIQPVDSASLATRLGAIDARAGLVIASSWLLECEGALAAAAGALRPGGMLTLVGRGMRAQARLARLSRPRAATKPADAETAPGALGLAFAGHLVAAAPTMLTAAVAAAEGRSTVHRPHRSHQARVRHFDVVLWRKTPRAEDGGAHA